MQPVLFEIPLLGIEIQGFGVMAMLSFIVGISLVLWRVRDKELPAPFVMDLGIVCLISGIVGARIFFVIENSGSYNWSLFYLLDGGYSIPGAILGFVLPFMAFFGWRTLLDYEQSDAPESRGEGFQKEADKEHPNTEAGGSSTIYWLVALGLLGSLLLSRVGYVYLNPELYNTTIGSRSVSPFDFLKIWQGGIVFYGGLFGGILGGVGYIVWNGYSVLQTADVFAAPFLLAQAVARWGCFLVGDDFGTRVSDSFPFAVQFPRQAMVTKYQMNAGIIEAGAEHSTWLHPAQLYMSGGVFLCFLILLGIEYVGRTFSRSETPFYGWSFGWMLVLYSIHRFIVEFFRGDPVAVFSFAPIPSIMKTVGLPRVHSGLMDPAYALRISQFLSLLLLVGAVIFLVVCWWTQRDRNGT